MNKVLLFILSCVLAIVLAACGSDENETMEGGESQTETEEENQPQDEENVETDGNKEKEDKSGNADEHSSATNSGFFEVTEEPQTDLSLGETGLIQTSIGTYELTIDSAQIIGTELDGEVALLDELILLEMTFKNISDEPIVAEDIMLNLGLTTDLESTDHTNAAASFESIENFEGEIAPGEERKAQFIADTRTAEQYFFRTNPGTVAAGTQNEVVWSIMDAEVRNE